MQLVLTSITNGLNFVHVIVVNNVIKRGVELVEEVHHLVRGAGARQLREAHDVTVTSNMQLITAGSRECKTELFEGEWLLYTPEVHSCVSKGLGLRDSTLTKVISHRFWQHT